MIDETSVAAIAELDARWTIRQGPHRPQVADAAVFTLGSGGVAAAGTPEEAETATAPGVLVAGVYTGTGPEQQLLQGPRGTGVAAVPATPAEQALDLNAGVLWRVDPGGVFRSLRFACAHRPGVLAMRCEASTSGLRAGPPLHPPPEQADVTVEFPMGTNVLDSIETSCMRVESTTGAGIAAAAAQSFTPAGEGARLDRIAVFAADSADRPGTAAVRQDLRRAWEHGVDGLLAAHRRAWAQRWDTVGIDLPDDPETELAVRFALFQLWCNADAHEESAVGARGISGGGYRGHVFWDADAFVLPAMVSIDPDAAEAMVTYRLRRLAAARDRAREEGRRGARFPWESAAEGVDVTPRSGFLGGVSVPILTGTREEHVTADIAWAVDRFAEWTGRAGFPDSTARDLLVETARYWASRVELDDAGRAHIRCVIGPDEYHESVDDNAYTNVMARWNLRRAAHLAPRNAEETAEFATWPDLADRIVDQLRPDGRYEQFTGYFDLEPLTVADVARSHLAADVLLGQDRVSGSQLIKQPDVLMLHHLIPDAVAPGSLLPNLDFYEPRTTHGSSLSPAVMAAVQARAGRPDAALVTLRAALRLDLDDIGGSTASGLHMAAVAGVWQAILTGFAGVRVERGMLTVRPHLPARWSRLRVAFRCLDRCVRLDLTPDRIAVEVDGPLAMVVGDHSPQLVSGECCWPAREGEQP